MKYRSLPAAAPAFVPVLFLSFLLAPATAASQGTLEDYRRADGLADRFGGLVVDVADNVRWAEESTVFTWRRSVEGGHRFWSMDATETNEREAFDHDRLARVLSDAMDDTFEAVTLPFSSVELVDHGAAIAFSSRGAAWRCDLATYECDSRRQGPPGPGGGGGPGGGSDDPVPSPDGRLEAFIHNHNVAVREVGSDTHTVLATDGSEGAPYQLRTIVWSPDSRRLAAYRVTPGYERLVHYVESSPADQLQPLHFTRSYRKPGDVLDVRRPALFDVEDGTQVIVDDALFPHAYSVSALRWREDGRAFHFEYNQRGHDVYRVIEVDARTGEARAVISEEPETFFYYRDHDGQGKRFRHDLDDGREIIWMSERDGWNHLYLYDGTTGRVKNQITRGEWVVRQIDHVDEEARVISFQAGGTNPDQDPYFVHHYSIGFDGTGLRALTEANATHSVSYSPDMAYYVASWSRIDHPDVTELRRTTDGALVAELGRGDHSALLAAGWSPPEVFVAKGRDGETDIWGVIVRPTNFDPSRSYPVIESIYAGPQWSFVPKTFSWQVRGMQQQAELGFIVVQIDGMGTSNRSKAFHDVAWRDLGDAGFPDRILWHEAVAARYPHYDISRVGIYGGSAGGQNAMGGLLFHPDFYHVAVAANGCHDNRMDKIWWNELWMGEVGPHYAASSNVDNAHLLQGQLLLIVGELDTNVDPSSTFQVVDALIKADKDFDLLVLPGGGHSSGGAYGLRRRFDFFVRHLLDVKPPDWNGGIALAEDDADTDLDLDFGWEIDP